MTLRKAALPAATSTRPGAHPAAHCRCRCWSSLTAPAGVAAGGTRSAAGPACAARSLAALLRQLPSRPRLPRVQGQGESATRLKGQRPLLPGLRLSCPAPTTATNDLHLAALGPSLTREVVSRVEGPFLLDERSGVLAAPACNRSRDSYSHSRLRPRWRPRAPWTGRAVCRPFLSLSAYSSYSVPLFPVAVTCSCLLASCS